MLMAFNKENFFLCIENNDILELAFYSTAGANLDSRDKKGRTALHIATEFGHTGLFQILMNMGVDPSICLPDGYNVITMVVCLMDSDAELNILEALLKTGINPDLVDANGYTGLQMAILYSKRKYVDTLMSYGASILFSSPHSSCESPLNLLISPEETIPDRDILLQRALSYTDKDQRDDNGNTILHAAISSGRSKDALLKLLKYGSKEIINSVNIEGNTPLHLAIELFNTRSLIPLLLGYGANPYIRNKQDKNCFALLKEKNEFGLLSHLKEYSKKHNLRDKYTKMGEVL